MDQRMIDSKGGRCLGNMESVSVPQGGESRYVIPPYGAPSRSVRAGQSAVDLSARLNRSAADELTPGGVSSRVRQNQIRFPGREIFSEDVDHLLRRRLLFPLRGAREVRLRDDADAFAPVVDHDHAPDLPVGHQPFDVFQVVVGSDRVRIRRHDLADRCRGRAPFGHRAHRDVPVGHDTHHRALIGRGNDWNAPTVVFEHQLRDAL
jgi:hypothetical protein